MDMSRFRLPLPTPGLRRLLWLVLPLALVVAPHLPRLPFWVGLTWTLCALVRLQQARTGSPPIRRAIRYVLAFAALAGIFLQFGTVFGPSGGVALLVLLTGLKLLETDSPRDHGIMVFIGYFLLMAHFLNGQGMLMAAYLMLVATLLTASLASLHTGQPRPTLALIRTAGVLMLQALPLAIALFLLFPRLHAPLGGLIQTDTGNTGMSDSMRPGSVSRLIQSDAVAFRVDFARENRQVDGSQLYWRGPVLWNYDGETWRPADNLPLSPLEADELSSPIRYAVTLEPHGQRWLFVAGLALRPPQPDADLTADLQWFSKRPIHQRLRYELSASLGYRLEKAALHPHSRALGLALPAGRHHGARRLVQQWLAEGRQGRALVDAALALFHEEAYYYTLTPPLLGEDAVDDFLFNTRRGFCEHYAGAFTVLMRLAGLPARVVTGYQGGERNPLGDYWIVRQRDAHAWSEVWLAGEGWIRVDPTAAIHPSRVERGFEAGAIPGARPLVTVDAGWLAPLGQAWDLLNSRWNQWVLGYDHARQKRLLERLSPSLASLKGMLWSLLAVGGLTLLLILALVFRPSRSGASDPTARLYADFCRRLARVGLPRQPWEAPHDYAGRVAQARPDLATATWHISRLYVALRYGPPGQADAQALRLAVRAFRPGRPP